MQRAVHAGPGHGENWENSWQREKAFERQSSNNSAHSSHWRRYRNQKSIFYSIAEASVHVLSDFDPRHLSNLIYACSLVDCIPKYEDGSTFLDLLAAEVINTLDRREFNSQDLSNILWAYATAKEHHPKLFKEIADHMMACNSLGEFRPQALSNIAWAYATAGESHPTLFNKIADQIISFHSLDEFKSQALSNIAWAYSTAGESHPKLFKKIADHIMACNSLVEFNSQSLSNIVWAYATAKESHSKLFHKISDAAIERQHEFNPQAVANFLSACATNGYINQNLFLSFVPSVNRNVKNLNSQGLGNIAWAFSVSNVSDPSLFNDDFIQACILNEEKFIIDHLRQLHQWQLWQEELQSSIRLPTSLQEKCYEAFISEPPNPSALQDDVVSELSTIGLQPEEEMLTRGGYRLDALVERNEKKIGVEVDGPFHFLGRQPTGSTILKRRQVTNLDGIQIVSVLYWEWDMLRKDRGKKQQYLRALLGLK